MKWNPSKIGILVGNGNREGGIDEPGYLTRETLGRLNFEIDRLLWFRPSVLRVTH